MRVARVAVHGVGGVPDGWVDLTRGQPEPARLVAIAGPPGAGKTRWLEVVVAAKEATAPYGSTPASDAWIARGRGAAKVSVEWWLDPAEAAFAGVESSLQTAETIFAREKLPRTHVDPGLGAVLGRYDHDPEIAKVDYFPADRAIPASSPHLGSLVAQQRLLRLSSQSGKYGALVRWAGELARTAEDGWRRLTELFERLARGRRLLAVEDGSGGVAFDTGRGDVVDVHRLGSADKMAFLFAATALMVGLRRSVVLVDTPELHLPADQTPRLLGELLAACPASQWIVATHDPKVMELAETVIHLGERR